MIVRLSDPPVEATVLSEGPDFYVVTYRSPFGWTCPASRRPKAECRKSGDPRAEELLRRRLDDPKFYTYNFMQAARALLLEVRGTAPRNVAAMVAKLEEM